MAITTEGWNRIVSIAQVVLGTTVVGIFSAIISHQIQTREVEIKEQEQISKNLATVLSTNAGDKLLMAQFYAAVTRSDAIRLRWETYRDELRAEIKRAEAVRERTAQELNTTSDAKAIDQKEAIIQNINARIVPGVKPTVSDRLPARIYFHIRREEQRQPALAVAKILDDEPGRTVPGVQLVRTGPSSSELRYFKKAEAVEAEAIAQALSSHGVPVRTRYYEGYEATDRLRPKHFELWLANDWH